MVELLAGSREMGTQSLAGRRGVDPRIASKHEIALGLVRFRLL